MADNSLNTSEINWASVELPDTWIDQQFLSRPWFWPGLARHFWRAPQHRVQVPENMPGKEWIPPYVLQTFHNLPNGNYSNHISRGYITGFDHVMLGEMHKVREKLAVRFQHCQTVLDVGCGGGRMANMLHCAGVEAVWGLDPSPYLLRHAAKEYPLIHFVQGIAEDMRFDEATFDGVIVCFLFHEMPPRYIEKALREIFRVLKPGAEFAICEPSSLQLTLPILPLLQRYSWRGIYFRLLAKYIHEPFLAAWHNLDVKVMLTHTGFELVAVEESMPVNCWIVRKPH